MYLIIITIIVSIVVDVVVVVIVIVVVVVFCIVQYLIDKGQLTALYKIQLNVCIKTPKQHSNCDSLCWCNPKFRIVCLFSLLKSPKDSRRYIYTILYTRQTITRAVTSLFRKGIQSSEPTAIVITCLCTIKLFSAINELQESFHFCTTKSLSEVNQSEASLHVCLQP